MKAHVINRNELWFKYIFIHACLYLLLFFYFFVYIFYFINYDEGEFLMVKNMVIIITFF